MSFEQSRKEQAQHTETIVQILGSYYNVDEERVVCVETQQDGKYSGRTPTQLLDYIGIDWLIDKQPGLVGVWQRVADVESGMRLSLRVDNGTAEPAEKEMIDAGFSTGIAPRDMLFAHQENGEITRYWICDTAATIDIAERHGELIRNDDGTAGLFVSIGTVAEKGAVSECDEL
jgi:hypothetical protein